MKEVKVSARLSDSERSALICVLPLLHMASETDYDRMLSGRATSSLLPKLKGQIREFSSHEVAAMADAVDIALTILSGTSSVLNQKISSDPEWLRQIKQHFLTLNRLAPILKGLFAQMETISR